MLSYIPCDLESSRGKRRQLMTWHATSKCLESGVTVGVRLELPSIHPANTRCRPAAQPQPPARHYSSWTSPGGTLPDRQQNASLALVRPQYLGWRFPTLLRAQPL